jgi:ubiquinone/menaquinone biosynthesis C-methylase UbiE
MADESMVRTLAAQAEAVWPQELPLLRRHALPPAPRILDAGCGTGEGTWRLARAFPGAIVRGVDVLDGSLERARARAREAGVADRTTFENRSIFALGLPDASFDLVACRHVLQSIPHAERAIAELVRVTRPGGVVHLVAEDYGMIHFPRRKLDPSRLWPVVPMRFGAATGTDMLVGRHAPAILRSLGLGSIALDLVVVDTLRVERAVFARIWEAWRDGYADVAARYGEMTRDEAVAHFDDQIATILDEGSYAAWVVPVVSGVVPPAGQ